MEDTEKPLTPEQQEQLMALKAFLINHKDLVEMWAKNYEKEPHIANNPPIVWDPIGRVYWWMNRKERRRIRRGKS